jgi:hypothetical protein
MQIFPYFAIAPLSDIPMDAHRPMRQSMISLQEHLAAIRFFVSSPLAQHTGCILNPSFAMSFASCGYAKASRCFFCSTYPAIVSCQDPTLL